MTRFLTLLGLAFIVLKLAGVVSWPWFWVMSPIIASILVSVLFYILVLWYIENN